MPAEGVPVTQLAAQLGHAKNSLTLDVYGQRSHELKLGHDVALVWPRDVPSGALGRMVVQVTHLSCKTRNFR